MSSERDTEFGAPAFDRYADWYDVFYAGKDYEAESEYVLAKIRRFCETPRRWLDIGCGTGRHLAYLHSLGLDVEGVDVSQAMITRARLLHRGIPFHVGGAQDFRLPGDRDVVSMLFHVMSYQTSDAMVREAMMAVERCLSARGVFAFDFWNSDAVLRDPPGRRLRQIQIDGRSLLRLSTPVMRPDRNGIDVRYEFRWDSPIGTLEHEEVHALRHFTGGELERFLQEAGMRLLTSEGWMRDRALSSDDWYGFICACREEHVHERRAPQWATSS